MSEPTPFPSVTPNFGLPLLIAGQSQKEFFVNQALSVLDALSSQAVVASKPTPPEDAAEGESFRVTSPAAQAWTGCEDHIAIRIGGSWHFVPPSDGMRLFDRTATVSLFFRSGWKAESSPVAPTGGAIVDAEARAALVQLIQMLGNIGLLGPSTQ
ncbi:DUF2793 domain-containing protein [Porphyrobacter sp. AAP60]|uniref:DUF2793 domain-containing protein n=1 Tax=Porphyrobacter sp. AAP60 TaxID=1523423 RepID=UPI0006B8D1CF|nr:DUF2793 domain-containing protein [Porphyrobacter sp. AAP60]KPF62998.1 hypothetical protein IP79_10540 [Porphyrobacter sp. AAP60]